MEFFTQESFKTVLEAVESVVTDKIFVYKSGFVGNAYVNKEALTLAGVKTLNNCLRGMVQYAIDEGFNLSFFNGKTVGIIGPAYGAISYPPVVAEYLQDKFPSVKFLVARTQLDKEDNHEIPQKLISLYEKVDAWIIVEDIVNQGSTISEVSKLLKKLFGKEVFSALSLVDRGGKSAEDFGVRTFYPFLRVNMEQVDPRKDSSIFDSGMEIHMQLGKGAKWVDEFGLPPYAPGTDFGSFSLFQ